MSLTIWKYEAASGIVHQIPFGAICLTVQVQAGKAQMWFLVNPKADLQTRCFRIYGTGHKIEDVDSAEDYCGTFQDGPFVWHVFEVAP